MKHAVIEQLILAQGTRGMERTARYLPPDYASRAAHALWRSSHVLITTGFYVDGHPETDGPPGAFFLGRALAAQGASICFVAERFVLDLLAEMAGELWRPGSGAGASSSRKIASPDFIEPFTLSLRPLSLGMGISVLRPPRPYEVVLLKVVS